MKAVVTACERFLVEINDAIDLATDPVVDVVGRLKETEHEVIRIQTLLNAKEAEMHERDLNIQDLLLKIAERDAELDKWKGKALSARKQAKRAGDLVNRLGADPSTMAKLVDLYSPDGYK